jgi:hypothetical protein
MKKTSYSAVVLNKNSRKRLINRFKSEIPEDWELIAHHMTINLGEIYPEYEKYLGLSIQLSVNDIAMDDKVIAVGVSGFYSKNKKSHITIAINRKAGGKSMMANNLTNWKELKRPIVVFGKVTEIEYK